MGHFSRNYGRVLAMIVLFGGMLLLDDYFTRPLAFISGVAAESLKRYELAAFVMAVTLLCARFVRQDIVHGVLERRAGGDMPKLVGDLTSTVIIFTGICVIVGFVFKKDITALLATGGVGLMVLGLALRDMLLAAFTGMLLNIEKPFRPGDLVRINDKYFGRVRQITWRTTILETTANEMLVIPNLTMSSAVILNMALPDQRWKRAIEVVIDYDTTVESAERILYAAVLGAEISLIGPPAVLARRLETDGVLYEVSFVITKYDDYKKAEHAVIKSILQCMRDAGISVSLPKSEVVNLEQRIGIANRALDCFHLVQQCRLFRGFPDNVCQHIADALVEHHFPMGTTIVRGGERRYSLFIVGEGMARRTQANRDGSSLVDQRFIATESFGRRSLFACQPQSATVVAETNTLVYELPSSVLAQLLRDIPELAEALAQSLAQINLRESRAASHQTEQESDPQVLARLVNLYRGQIQASYGQTLKRGFRGTDLTKAEQV